MQTLALFARTQAQVELQENGWIDQFKGPDRLLLTLLLLLLDWMRWLAVMVDMRLLPPLPVLLFTVAECKTVSGSSLSLVNKQNCCCSLPLDKLAKRLCWLFWISVARLVVDVQMIDGTRCSSCKEWSDSVTIEWDSWCRSRVSWRVRFASPDIVVTSVTIQPGVATNPKKTPRKERKKKQWYSNHYGGAHSPRRMTARNHTLTAGVDNSCLDPAPVLCTNSSLDYRHRRNTVSMLDWNINKRACWSIHPTACVCVCTGCP